MSRSSSAIGRDCGIFGDVYIGICLFMLYIILTYLDILVLTVVKCLDQVKLSSTMTPRNLTSAFRSIITLDNLNSYSLGNSYSLPQETVLMRPCFVNV